MKYGKAIKVVRSARGMPQKDLAKRAGLNPSYLSLVEGDARKPSSDALESLAKALDVPLYLLTLLASDREHLRGIPVKEAQRLGLQLLDILVGVREREFRR